MALGFSGMGPRWLEAPAARRGALGLLVLLASACWFALGRPDARPASEGVAPGMAAATATAGNLPTARAPAAVAAENLQAASAASDAIPEGMTRAQWNGLREQLAGQPHADVEIARVTDTMAYLARLARYRVLRGSGAEALPEARELADGLLARLPIHVALNEMSLGEARRLQDALFGTLGTADAARAVERDRLQAAAPATPGLAAQAEQDARFQRESADLLAAWKRQAPAQRDARQLEASLETLRQSVFSPAETSSAHLSTGVSR